MKLTDAELIAAIEAEEALSEDALAGQLQQERTEALARYKGDLLGNEQEGRSAVVAKDVLDTIEWIMPSLIRIYMGGDEIGKFQAVSPDDEQKADIETEVCNWFFNEKNDAFSQISSILKDALLLKNGYAVAYWDQRYDTMTETYQGLSDEEAAMLSQDPEITVVEHSETQDPALGTVHEVKIERKKCDEYVAFEAIPPDEMKVGRRHRWTSLLDADFVQWNRRITIGQARAEGFKIPDDVPGYEDNSMENVTRERFVDVTEIQDQTTDPTRRLIKLKDTYIRIDLRDKGTPQLWRVVHVSGSKEPVLKEEADIIPFAAFSPIIYPHSHVGMSVYDLIADIGSIKTTLQRQFLDGVYLANSQQYAIDVNLVNVDDFLVSRPGGIKRVEGSPANAIMPLPSNDVGQVVLGALEYMDGVKEGRTGVTRYSAGLDANSLNKTATGIQSIQSAANQRIELIARTLASGFKDLFLIIHALVCKHGQKPIQVKLKGQWQAIDPRSWVKRTDFQISVGLGTGNPEQQLQKLMALAPLLQQGMQAGIVGPDEVYAYAKEVLKAAGYKNPKFIHEPQKDQTGKSTMPPPPPDPMVQSEQIKQQGQMQQKQLDMQLEGQKLQMATQAEGAKLQMESQVAQASLQAEHAFELQKLREQLASNERIAAMNNATKTDLELAKMAEERALQLHVQDQENQRTQQTVGLEKEKLAHGTALEQQKMSVSQQSDQQKMQHERALAGAKEPGAPDPLHEMLSQHTATMQELMRHLASPKVVDRGPDGKVVGVRSVTH